MRIFSYLFLATVFFAPSLLANDIPVKSKITEVTVYRQGASVTRIATVDVPAGTSIITFEELAPNIDPNSVQVSATGGFVVMSVVQRNNYLEVNEFSQEIQELVEKEYEVYRQVSVIDAEMGILEDEKKLLLANLSATESSSKIDINQLRLASEFFRERMKNISMESIDLKYQRRPLAEELGKIRNQLKELRSHNRNRSVIELDVTVQSTSSVKSDFTLSYLTYQAGWVPHYDMRVNQLSEPIEITYAANVQQSTGEEWENVNLTLSTGNPRNSGNKPEIEPWRLRYQPPPRAYNQDLRRQSSAKSRAESDEVVVEYERPLIQADAVAGAYEAVTVVPMEQNFNATTIEYEISLPYTIKSDGKPNSVDIDEREVSADFEYFAIPKVDRSAYLTAKMSDWEDLYFQPGEANLFLEGTYVGKTYLNIGVEDTLVVSLGRDENIKIKRDRAKEFTSRRTLSRKKTESRGWAIDVRNNKGADVNLVIIDQIPLSTDKDIEIELKEHSSAEYDEDMGYLTWRLNLEAGESASKKFSYEVKYPKNRRVVLE